MVVNLERELEAADPSLRHPHIPNIMMDKHNMKGMIMAIGTTLGMGPMGLMISIFDHMGIK